MHYISKEPSFVISPLEDSRLVKQNALILNGPSQWPRTLLSLDLKEPFPDRKHEPNENNDKI